MNLLFFYTLNLNLLSEIIHIFIRADYTFGMDKKLVFF